MLSDPGTPPSSDVPILLTGAEAGFAGDDQIRIALQTMANQGGSATMRQITDAMDQAMSEDNSHHKLSSQGKASLRRYVNTNAVEKGWVYKYDERQSAWRITPSGRAAISALLSKNPTQVSDWSQIGRNFQIALTDVYALLDAETKFGTVVNAPPAFVRASVILTVTAWETFVEDTIAARFATRLASAKEPNDISSASGAVAKKWLDGFGEKRPGPKDILKWAGSGWKEQISEHFANDLRAFNTPSSENIAKITKQYVGEDLTSRWKLHGIDQGIACDRLDKLIHVRGSLVHRARSYADSNPPMDGAILLENLGLVEQLAWSTDAQWNRPE